MFEAEKFVDEVFTACVTSNIDEKKFNAKSIIAKIFDKIEEGENGYWQQKNVTNSMNNLEGMRWINGELRPEFLPNLNLPIEVRHGSITSLGRYASHLPSALRILWIAAYQRRKKLLSVLGVLAFIRLLHNALQGTQILIGTIEYISAVILAYILYLIILHFID